MKRLTKLVAVLTVCITGVALFAGCETENTDSEWDKHPKELAGKWSSAYAGYTGAGWSNHSMTPGTFKSGECYLELNADGSGKISGDCFTTTNFQWEVKSNGNIQFSKGYGSTFLNESYKYGKSGGVEALELSKGLQTKLNKGANTLPSSSLMPTGYGETYIKNFIKKK